MLAIRKALGFTPISEKNVLSALPSPLAEVQHSSFYTPSFARGKRLSFMH